MAVQYYLFPKIRAVEFRAHAGAYVVGVPQPTAMAGFAYALGLKLSEKTGLKLNAKPGVLYGVSDFSGFSGPSLNQRSGSDTLKSKAPVPAPIDDRVRASATITLFLELSADDENALPSAAQVQYFIERMRIQSASLFIQSPGVASHDLQQLLKKVPSDVFFLLDSTQDMQASVEAGLSPAEALAQKIRRPADNSTYKPRWVPLLVGWRPFQELAGIQAEPVLTEPVLGLGLFASKGSLRTKAADPEFPLFWKHSVEAAPLPHYVVKAFPPAPSEVDLF
jgi:hypothetical protein